MSICVKELKSLNSNTHFSIYSFKILILKCFHCVLLQTDLMIYAYGDIEIKEADSFQPNALPTTCELIVQITFVQLEPVM